MAEVAKQKAQGDEKSTTNSEWKENLTQVGWLFFTAFVSGVAAAAGRHAYHSTASKLGGNTGNVVPIKRAS